MIYEWDKFEKLKIARNKLMRVNLVSIYAHLYHIIILFVKSRSLDSCIFVEKKLKNEKW